MTNRKYTVEITLLFRGKVKNKNIPKRDFQTAFPKAEYLRMNHLLEP
jgi:hypothetical protein